MTQLTKFCRDDYFLQAPVGVQICPIPPGIISKVSMTIVFGILCNPEKPTPPQSSIPKIDFTGLNIWTPSAYNPTHSSAIYPYENSEG
jgi:hypothetical protein